MNDQLEYLVNIVMWLVVFAVGMSFVYVLMAADDDERNNGRRP